MIAYVCKYTPAEVLESMGAEMVRLEPEVTDFDCADARMHPNVCSYAKAVLEEFSRSGAEGIVLTTCCDSVRRLYDVLRAEYPRKFIRILDVPRRTGEAAAGMFTGEIRALAEDYAAFCGHPFREEELRALLLRRQRQAAEIRPGGEVPPGPRVALLGARCGKEVSALLERSGLHAALNMTCTGQPRAFSPAPEGAPQLACYARQLLGQLPCLRMTDVSARGAALSRFSGELDGIVYHTVKFCDLYSYEYSALKPETELPVLKLETDTTPQCAGQLRTRIEAFAESLGAAKRAKAERCGRASETKREGKQLYVLGIDSGSTSTNAVILNGKREIVASGSVRTGAKTSESAARILAEMLEKSGLSRSDLAVIVSTGYGRVSIPFADRNVTEISCHGKGARYFNPNVMTILDIGGQDSKAIRLNEAGEVADFAMNDKCAAGTGRFLEAMARTLELELSELGPVSLQSRQEVPISSMCTVFAESEVISLIAQNCEKADIARGVHRAIAGKACSLLARVNPCPEYMMTGGVAKNPGVVRAVEEKLGAELFLCPDPEIVGAVGAALCGLEEPGA